MPQGFAAWQQEGTADASGLCGVTTGGRSGSLRALQGSIGGPWQLSQGDAELHGGAADASGLCMAPRGGC